VLSYSLPESPRSTPSLGVNVDPPGSTRKIPKCPRPASANDHVSPKR
jgi:hypothetical protein